MNQHTPFRLPDTMMRADIGPYLKGLREHFNLTQQDVSERTHIRARYIQAIEVGAMDQMPGKAYAKGYVHTYAEFLGLDPEQVVAIFFGVEPVRETAKHFVPEPMKRTNTAASGGLWRTLAVGGVVVALLVLAIGQFSGREAHEDAAATASETVSDVPEDMLVAMRTLVMPERGNQPCIGDATPLGCLFLTPEWQMLAASETAEPYYFAMQSLAPVKPDDADADTATDTEAQDD